MKTPELSVVIPTRNRTEHLLRLLGELCRQTLDVARWEVVVVDDGSLRPVLERLDGWHFPFVLRAAQQYRQGSAAARHRGALLAKGEVLLFLDDDLCVSPGLLEAHLRVHQNGRRRLGKGAALPGSPSANVSIRRADFLTEGGFRALEVVLCEEAFAWRDSPASISDAAAAPGTP